MNEAFVILPGLFWFLWSISAPFVALLCIRNLSKRVKDLERKS